MVLIKASRTGIQWEWSQLGYGIWWLSKQNSIYIISFALHRPDWWSWANCSCVPSCATSARTPRMRPSANARTSRASSRRARSPVRSAARSSAPAAAAATSATSCTRVSCRRRRPRRSRCPCSRRWPPCWPASRWAVVRSQRNRLPASRRVRGWGDGHAARVRPKKISSALIERAHR